MNFTTPIPISKHEINISHKDKIMLLGSCFTENIGNKLTTNGFETLINPFGILYNPISINSCLNRIIELKYLNSDSLVQVDEFWYSYEHHGKFRDENKDKLLQTINLDITNTNLFLKQTDWLIITLGTAWVFFLKENNQILGNCHKLNPQLIDKRLLSTEEIYKDTILTINKIRKINPNIKIILTVSPIRHWKQGYRENLISKSTLHIAVDQICKTTNNCSYFPAYEIVMDELRDYRFYQADMLHPSEVTVDYIWEKFSNHLFTDSTISLCKDYLKLHSMKQHKAFNPESQGYKKHLIKIANLEQELYEKRNKLI
ncbi:MAG: GSCFA domain-containing protein [Bacteroidales bacterium]|nr:GSCFA domain-containing protein [Bacteroidales bacterium]